MMNFIREIGYFSTGIPSRNPRCYVEDLGNQMSLPISAVIIAYNEERNLERCLSSLTWADEIVVVDGGSKDKTLEICERKDAPWSDRIKVFKRPWDGFRNQRNFSIQQASYDWVLVVDADEKCTPELAAKTRELLSSPQGPVFPAYKIRRIEFFLGKKIQYGIWNPSYQDRFFNRVGVEYINNIHEYPKFLKEPGLIHEPLEHSPDFTVERFLDKMNRYTSVEALDRVQQGKRTNPFRLFFAFPAMFLKNYFYYSAYKDGIHGFVISLMEGVSRAVRHIKMWQYQREK
jgi:glycosyltransferase involved in cell wall biosynthesis